MELSLETYIKHEHETTSEELGRARVVVSPGGYQHLASLEARLQETGSDEIIVDIDPAHIDYEMPSELSAVAEPKLRVTLEKDASLGHFHVVARHGDDNRLIYTNKATIRTLAM